MTIHLSLLLLLMAIALYQTFTPLATKRARTQGKAGRTPGIQAWFPRWYHLKKILRNIRTLFHSGN